MSEIRALRTFLERHRSLLVLTGAGCSAPSGIPDYRDRYGAWKHTKPMTIAQFKGSTSARQRYWAGSLRGWPRVHEARPNAAHAALARLEAKGPVRQLVTQNVDGLHQRAGSRRVLDLHGRLDMVECLDCGARVRREDLQRLLAAWNPSFAARPCCAGVDHLAPGVDGTVRPDGDTPVSRSLASFRVPDCPECGGTLKPGVVFFGENVPRSRVAAVETALEESDANRARGQRRKAGNPFQCTDSGEPVPPPPERAALRRRWANLIRRVYEVDPLVCPRCESEMRVIAFITEPRVIKRILDHIRKRDRAPRAPPRVRSPVALPPAARPA